jgi:hypothetical protein
MGSEPGHEAIATGTRFQICFRKTTNMRRASIRTLIARIQFAFSSVVNFLHSLRIAGFVQVQFSYEQDTTSTDQRKARETERSL